jgi:DivIVA domain-containing protein
MALLTAEDVLNKAFSKTKYREGFDQDEVDDFLDEVANTIAQLTAERDELAARVANGGAAVAPAAPTSEAPTTTGLLAAATEPGGVNPTGMLAMAQKLHDEYVQAGEAERDRIIDEANAAADQIRERADDDAKARMDELAGERSELEGRIDDLRRFERDYRARLKAYLENLLGDLDHSGIAGAAGLAAGAAVLADGPADADAAPAEDVAAQAEPVDEAPDETAVAEGAPSEGGSWEPDAVIVEDVVVAETFETEDGATAVVVEEFESVTPVSFDEALAGAAEPAAPAEEEPVAAPPAYDASQPWETQLRQPSGGGFSNPFAPVTQPAGEEAPTAEATPEVASADEPEEPPYTPPSSRMFTDLYGQQRTEGQN